MMNEKSNLVLSYGLVKCKRLFICKFPVIALHVIQIGLFISFLVVFENSFLAQMEVYSGLLFFSRPRISFDSNVKASTSVFHMVVSWDTVKLVC